MYCEACGGWDRYQGGVGHRLGCPVGAAGQPIGSSFKMKSRFFVIYSEIFEQISYEEWGKLTNSSRNIEHREEFSKGEIIYLKTPAGTATFILHKNMPPEVRGFNSREAAEESLKEVCSK